MKQTENLIKIVLIALFTGCLFKMPYSYYEISRFLGMIGFCILGYKSKNNIGMLVWFASALLINPFFKLALGRTIWNVIDVIWVIIILLSMFNDIKQWQQLNQ